MLAGQACSASASEGFSAWAICSLAGVASKHEIVLSIVFSHLILQHVSCPALVIFESVSLHSRVDTSGAPLQLLFGFLQLCSQLLLASHIQGRHQHGRCPSHWILQTKNQLINE